MKVRFLDLSVCLKIAVVLAWVVGVVYALAVLAGFFGVY